MHGQTIWIDPAAQTVIVRFASNPVAANGANDPTSLPAYRAVADYLMSHDCASSTSANAASPLLGAEWMIEDIAGRGVVDDSPASLQFLPDGRLAGNASWNRLIGSFTRDAQALSVTPAGTTMMMCPPALMEQERRLLELLPTIKSYKIDYSGVLILQTSDGKTITARR